MSSAGHITRKDLKDGAMVFAIANRDRSFTAREFASFAGMAALDLDEELANDILLEVVDTGDLREIGPGVYAIKGLVQ